MAEGATYPCIVTDETGTTRLAGFLTFTDDTNQPVPGGDGVISVSQLDATGITDGFLVTADTEVATWEAPA